MKTLLSFVLAALIVLAGCSTTHYLKYSKSDNQFYEDYNNSAGHKAIEVAFTNDSVMYYDNHSVIRDDTLYYFETESEEKNYNLPGSAIGSIHYTTNDLKNADLVLDNGEKLKAESISIYADSISFTGIREWISKKTLAPVDELKIVSYKNHWKGVIPGVLGGILLGGALGATGWIYHPMDGGNTETFAQAEATALGAISGLLIGGVVGYLLGFNVNYQFTR